MKTKQIKEKKKYDQEIRGSCEGNRDWVQVETLEYHT